MLRREEFMPHAPESPGLVHVNHTGCGAGVDTRKRLYIRRLSDGSTILAHCHNCGESGHVFETGFRSLQNIKDSKSTRIGATNSLSLPRDFETDTSSWSKHGRAWVYQYGITEDEIKRYGIGFSNSSGRVILPVWDDGELIAYQERRVHPEDDKPKYLTHWKRKNFVWKNLTVTDDVVVLCEDIISAIKVTRNFSAIAICGTHLHHDNYIHVLPFKKVVIFLDNDNAEVKMKSLKLQRDLSLYVPEVKVVGVEKNPKNCTDAEIINYVTR